MTMALGRKSDFVECTQYMHFIKRHNRVRLKSASLLSAYNRHGPNTKECTLYQKYNASYLQAYVCYIVSDRPSEILYPPSNPFVCSSNKQTKSPWSESSKQNPLDRIPYRISTKNMLIYYVYCHTCSCTHLCVFKYMQAHVYCV